MKSALTLLMIVSVLSALSPQSNTSTSPLPNSVLVPENETENLSTDILECPPFSDLLIALPVLL